MTDHPANTQTSLKLIPVNVITGALGVGKTTALARLLASKPMEEYWVVILNEFTNAGIDAVTLASAARGAYDVRVIPGGCLCCTGELDFRRQLREILKERRPSRILIEPSGIGHPGAVIEELRSQEKAGVLQLASTIGLVDPSRLAVFESHGVERDQLDSSDVLILSKADVATAEQRQAFSTLAAQSFPPKRWVGIGVESILSGEALQPPAAVYSFQSALRPALHASEVGHSHAPSLTERTVPIGAATACATIYALLGREACGWAMPRELIFNRVKLHQALQEGAGAMLANIERLKGVLRTGIEHWTLFHVSAAGVTTEPCGWRQDSRLEVQGIEGAAVDWRAWDDFLASMRSKG
ncbi:MAG TPA: GTP-binding protein [Steroidobacteraceae bacterium]|nr:GTP-binding protein [Steroidobacteraceae bacterium]